MRSRYQHLLLFWRFRSRRNERLVRSYFLVSVLLITGGLISAGLLEIYFRYHEGLEQVGLIQQDAANRAALRIERFSQDIATTMTAATKSAEITSPEISREYEFELKRLLFLAPAITEALALDNHGLIQAQASRFRAASPLVKRNLSQSAAFRESKQGKSYFGNVYLRDSEPYITVAVPIAHLPGEVMGVLQAETSLRDILDTVVSIKLGRAGYGYVVTHSGDLIAHSNISMVLQRRKIGQLDHVKSAFEDVSGTPKPNVRLTSNIDKQPVFSSHALVPILNWAVFIERPVEEAYEPIYASLLRTSILLTVGLGVALLATLFLRRRVVRPLETLRQGVEQIRAGDLTARLDVKTGDEIEVLAEEFNDMAAHLKEAYAGLERKVAERTQALSFANEKLAQASQHKSQFLANVSHELRTPVSAIIGYARLLGREIDGHVSASQRENLADLLHNAERLLNLIDSLLDVAKIEAGKMEIRFETVNIDEVITGAISIIAPSLEGRAVCLMKEISSDLPTLDTDREKLRQIVLNLLENAVKFTPSGQIKIAAQARNGKLKLVVSDTGVGIAKEDLPNLFEEFYRGKSPTRGTGLGLAITHQLVNILGGEISVESATGEGSSFTVTLPLKQSQGFASNTERLAS
jgi:signal transduction histidine kinase